MGVRFITKKLRKKVVRPMKNSAKHKNFQQQPISSDEQVESKVEEVVADTVKNEVGEAVAVDTNAKKETTDTTATDTNVKSEEIVAGTPAKKENKRQKKNNKMIDEEKLSQLESITETELPKQNVRVEKSDKGLYERTENSTILLTEDNKMLLTD